MAVPQNTYVSILSDKVQQADVMQAIRIKTNDWLSLFNNVKIQVIKGAGAGARYLINMPKPGKDWTPDLHPLNPASGFIRKYPMAFIDIPIIIDKVYSEFIPEDRLEDCLQTVQLAKELTTQLKMNVTTEIARNIRDSLRIIWTNDNNYWEATWDPTGGRWSDGNLFHFHPNYFRDPDWILKQLYDTGDEFLEPNTRFQKGFFVDGPISETNNGPRDRGNREHWHKIPTNTMDTSQIFLILNNPIVNTLKIGKMSVAANPAYVELKSDFGKVIKTKLPNDYQMIMQDNRVSVLLPKDQNKGFYHEFEGSNQTHWFHLPSRVYGGMVYCLNNCAWKSSTSKGKKDDPVTTGIGTVAALGGGVI